MRRRVVVTGVGLICALGIGTEQVWEKLLAGTAGVGPITQFDASAFDCRIAAEIRDFDPLNWIPTLSFPFSPNRGIFNPPPLSPAIYPGTLITFSSP